MKELNDKDKMQILGGGFAYDLACSIRYAGYFLKGYISSGGPSNISSTAIGVITAEANKCPS